MPIKVKDTLLLVENGDQQDAGTTISDLGLLGSDRIGIIPESIVKNIFLASRKHHK